MMCVMAISVYIDCHVFRWHFHCLVFTSIVEVYLHFFLHVDAAFFVIVKTLARLLHRGIWIQSATVLCSATCLPTVVVVPVSLIAEGHVDRLQQLCARESHKAP